MPFNISHSRTSFFVLNLIFCCLTFSFSSCETETVKEEQKKIKEGIIEYNVSYPYYTDDFMVKLLPDVMTMEFKDNVYKNEITKGGLFTTAIISDCNTQTFTMMLDFGSKKMYCVMDKNLTDTMVSILFKIPDILKVNNFDSIAGMPTSKYSAVYKNLEDGYDCDVYTTSAIDIKNSNWCNQYHTLDEVLLGYEVAQYGMVTRFIATKVTEQKIKAGCFDVPADFEEVTLDRMVYEMEEIFKSLIE
jgi:hypothetical protein